MKRILTYIILLASVSVSCNRYEADGYKFGNSIYMDVSSRKPVQSATFGNKLTEFSKELSVNMAYPAENDVTATIAVDESLVADYNSKYGTSYEMLPQKYSGFKEETVTIPAGKTMSGKVVIPFKGLAGEGEEQVGAMEIDKTYLFPVRLTSTDMDVMGDAGIAYYLVRRSLAITVAAQLTDNWINFPLMDEPGTVADAYNGLRAVTYEALIWIDKFDKENDFGDCNISTVMGVEQYLLLRIGDTNFERQQLQFDGSGGGTSFGKFPQSDPSKKLYEGRWYHVACTYDYDTRITRVYVDGKIQSEAKEMGTATGGINLAMRANEIVEDGKEKTSYQFFIGKSYNDYRPLQGKIAEARVWSVARTPEQIWENMYRIDNPEGDATLIGYWKFDEGKGNTVKDYSMYHNDGIAAFDLSWAEGIEIPEINKEEE